MAEPTAPVAGKKYTTQQILIGFIILALVLTFAYYYFSGKPTTVKLNSGTPVRTPGSNTPTVPIVPPTTPTAKKPFAKANNNYGVGVYDTDFKKWYDAPIDTIIGEIKGTKGDWTIVSTSKGDMYVYTKEITTTLI